MTNFVLSPKAQQDLAEIWLYTADRWGVEQAERYVLDIEHALDGAASGSPLVRPIDQLWRIRSGHHLCVFDRRDDGTIYVIRVLHERMDVKQQMGGQGPAVG
ncbi:MAG: type II toxin-antitoxin system RelE/ParE family toxin [Sphingomonadaceae bacterium]|nr:type II toxin-antitoxin system RelE/ParE family toxin [Sphingomonadaceae bacterium]